MCGLSNRPPRTHDRVAWPRGARAYRPPAQELGRHSVQANRVLALISKLFNLAELWGLRPEGTNPCRHVGKFREQPRERYLSGEELGRLGAALRDGLAAQNRDTIHGCRSPAAALDWGAAERGPRRAMGLDRLGTTGAETPGQRDGCKANFLECAGS